MSELRLIQSSGFETVKTLETLSEAARNGTVIGIAYVVFQQNRTYFTGFTGLARREPELALGTLKILEQDLIEKARNKI